MEICICCLHFTLFSFPFISQKPWSDERSRSRQGTGGHRWDLFGDIGGTSFRQHWDIFQWNISTFFEAILGSFFGATLGPFSGDYWGVFSGTWTSVSVLGISESYKESRGQGHRSRRSGSGSHDKGSRWHRNNLFRNIQHWTTRRGAFLLVLKKLHENLNNLW